MRKIENAFFISLSSYIRPPKFSVKGTNRTEADKASHLKLALISSLYTSFLFASSWYRQHALQLGSIAPGSMLIVGWQLTHLFIDARSVVGPLKPASFEPRSIRRTSFNGVFWKNRKIQAIKFSRSTRLRLWLRRTVLLGWSYYVVWHVYF